MQKRERRSCAAKLSSPHHEPAKRPPQPEPTPDVLYRRAISASVRALMALDAASAACHDVPRQVQCGLLSATLGRFLGVIMEEEGDRKAALDRPAGADAASFVATGGRA